MSYPLNMLNCEKSLEMVRNQLSGKLFNILSESDGKKLKFCNRELTGLVYSKNGQVSISLKPGGAIAWDINTEKVELEFGLNGDILLSRTFQTGRKKILYITLGPI